MLGRSKLKIPDALPGTCVQSAICDGDADTGADQCRLDMCLSTHKPFELVNLGKYLQACHLVLLQNVDRGFPYDPQERFCQEHRSCLLAHRYPNSH